MLFNSLEFLIFFPIVVAIYFALPERHRWCFLLAASYYFYMCWKAEYVVLILVSTLVDYLAGIQMGKATSQSAKRGFLWLSIVTNLSILFAFKYFNFFTGVARSFFDQFNLLYDIPAFDVLLPVGISFYTFQSMSYSIDVYRGDRAAERHFGVFALYVAFFPQLVAGPIERSRTLLPQFIERKPFNGQEVSDGLKLMLWGYFKKLVIADNLAIYVNEVYNHPGTYQGFTVLCATYLFAFQIFCDFSGYSDIARGAARVMGYRLSHNFQRPYLATSIADFWSRWHISLSTWFKDYLYVPLGGNRVGWHRWCLNIAVVFVLSGLWHGANWTFMCWGAIHGSYLLLSKLTQRVRSRMCAWFGLNRTPTLHRCVKVLVTFHLVAFGWLWFRAQSVAEALVMMRSLWAPIDWRHPGVFLEVMTRMEFGCAILAIVVMMSVQIVQRNHSVCGILSHRPLWIRWCAYNTLVVWILTLGNFGSHAFIYFQF